MFSLCSVYVQCEGAKPRGVFQGTVLNIFSLYFSLCSVYVQCEVFATLALTFRLPVGVFQGTIFVRYMTNRILLVAKYSPHFRRALVYTTRCRNADPIENLGDGTVFIVVAPEVRSRLYVTKESVHVVVL